MNYKNALALGFSTFATLLLTACPNPAVTNPRVSEPPKVSTPKLVDPIKPEAPVTLNAFLKHLDDATQSNAMSDGEKDSIKWMVAVLTNEDVMKKFQSLCSDTSMKQNLDACMQEARTKLFDVHSMSPNNGPQIFLKK